MLIVGAATVLLGLFLPLKRVEAVLVGVVVLALGLRTLLR
jgi:hypothetical protein